MHTKLLSRIRDFVTYLHREHGLSASELKSVAVLFSHFLRFLFSYFKKKVMTLSLFFEQNKNILVKFFMMKRGRYNRPFLHIAAMLVLGIGVLTAPFLADTYPIFSSKASLESKLVSTAPKEESIAVDTNVFQTNISQKPRDKVISYTVEKGDTISTISRKFDISEDTIKWANDLQGDSISEGDELKILPVSGISHKVQKGDTVYTIAKKYDTNPQKIVDFPFNDFANPETFSLVEGEIVIVPDGIKPAEQPFIKRQIFIAQGPVSVSSAGMTWPIHGEISQFPAWYHMAVDIAAPYGSPLVSAQSGTVTEVNVGTWDGGYGTSVYVQNGDLQTHYAHLSGVNVSAGQHVDAGKTVIGWIGLTGRTTGAHVHFEVRKDGVLVNPLPYLQ